MICFDSHAHIVSADHERYPIAPLSGELRAGDLDDPVTAERLLKMMDDNSVERALVVQRAHIYGFNNAYVVDSAARYPDRLRAMCMVDALAPDVAAQIRHWVVERGAIAIRLTEPFKGADTSWFSSPKAMEAWSTAAELKISLRLHLYRWNRVQCLPAIVPLVKQFSTTPVVIDHLSNLSAESGPPHHGIDEALRTLAARPNVSLLFSTINLAQLAAKNIAASPVLERVVKTFGAHRVMWGSDIAQSKGTYREMRELADAAVENLSPSEREQVMRGTGKGMYWPA